MKIFLSLLFLIFLPKAKSSVYANNLHPDKGFTFGFNIRTVNFSQRREEKVYRAIDLLSQVFADPEFKSRINQYSYDGQWSFANAKGFSNREVYQLILKGMEKLHPEENNAMDVELELYNDTESRVLGFTRTNSPRIWMNIKYFEKHTSAELAGHLTHEWLHKLGFGHEVEQTPGRRHSVPYAVGYIVREIAERIYEENCDQKESEERPWSFCN